jgi:hypothetical protein
MTVYATVPTRLVAFAALPALFDGFLKCDNIRYTAASVTKLVTLNVPMRYGALFIIASAESRESLTSLR